MGEWGFGKIASIILILIVVTLILFGYPAQIWKAVKPLLGFGDIIDGDITEINNNAQNGFTEMLKQIETCKAYKVNRCGCKIDLSSFNKVHSLSFTKNDIRMYNIKERSKTLMARSSDSKVTAKNLNCYVNKNGLKYDEEFVFNFDINGAYILTGYEDVAYGVVNLVTSSRKELAVDDKLQLYKGTEDTCWTVGNFDETLEDCSKKKI